MSYLDGDRRLLTLRPGGPWVLLVGMGAPVTYR